MLGLHFIVYVEGKRIAQTQTLMDASRLAYGRDAIIKWRGRVVFNAKRDLADVTPPFDHTLIAARARARLEEIIAVNIAKHEARARRVVTLAEGSPDQ